VNNNIEIYNDHDGTTYVENGYLSENIHDNLNVNEVAKLVIDKLYKQDFIKKNKSISKFNCEEIEDELAELIDGALSRGIMNYFTKSDNNIEVQEPRDFYCKHWI
jgi:hypothetical protein